MSGHFGRNMPRMGAILALGLLAPIAQAAEALGSIEGDIVLHGKPLVDVQVMLTAQMERSANFDPVKTDAQGHFKFDRVPAGYYAVGHLVSYHLGNSQWYTHSGTDSYRRNVIVERGEHVVLPPYPPGHAVRGRMVLAPGSKLDVAWQAGENRIIRSIGKTAPESRPGMSQEEYERAGEAWRKSKAFRENWPKETKIVVDVHPDGSFEAQDVPAGEYQIGIDVGRESAKGEADAAGHASGTFTMEAKDIDLGELTVKERAETPGK